MATAARVTVAITFRDEQRFLPAAVATVRGQSETAWELLLVDDGSTDGSGEMADAFAAADPQRVRVLRHAGGRNAGLPASRNLALGAARAERLCFLDADDVWAPDKLREQLAQLEAHPTALMTCGPSWHRRVDDAGPGELIAVLPDAPRLLRRGEFARMLVGGKLRTPPPSDVMYRRHALLDVGGIPDGPNMHEDQRTFVAVSLAGPVLVTDVPLTTYTVRPDSVFGAARDDGMTQVRDHKAFERWVRRVASRSWPAGPRVVAALAVRRLRRGLGRRARLLTERVRRRGG